MSGDDLLLRWLTSHGGVLSSKVEIGGEPRGMRAREPIRADEILLTVPSCLLVTAGKAQAAAATMAETDAIILFILSERSRGDASFWYPWINSLPRPGELDDSMPLLWEETGVEELLRCPAMTERAREQRQSVRARFEALPEPRPSWHEFAWAWAIVESRSLYLEAAALGASRHCL